VTLTNGGQASCEVSNVSLKSNSDPAFSILPDQSNRTVAGTGTEAGPLPIVPGGQLLVTVRFAPAPPATPTTITQSTTATGTLQFSSNDTAHANVSVPLKATLPHCTVKVVPTSLDFGTVDPSAFVDQQITVQNLGNGVCSLANFSFGNGSDPGFSLTQGNLEELDIFPEGQTTVSVRFTAPSTTALPIDRTGTLTFATNDAALPTASVSLTAKLKICQLTASPDPLDFGNVGLNLTVTDQLTLSNQGTSDCVVNDIALASGTAPEFALPPQPGTITIAPGGSGAISVKFSADDSSPPHQRTGTLDFSSNDPTHTSDAIPLAAYINTICTQAGQYIYTVDNSNNILSRFDPVALTSTDIGALNCPSSSSPFSMDLDQSAVAWVLYGDGSLFRVDTTDASCSATNYVADQDGIDTYGMGSVFNSSTGVDTLYICGGGADVFGTNTTLATLDLQSFVVTPIASVSFSLVELAGTGDGQLWVFSPGDGSTFPRVLARIDPATGSTLEQYDMSSITTGDQTGWAIKFFGGAFYIFLGPDVWKVDRSTLVPSQDTQTTPTEPKSPPQLVYSNPGRDIVGAGVSTCAPVQ
jgi:hypothetical protein